MELEVPIWSYGIAFGLLKNINSFRCFDLAPLSAHHEIVADKCHLAAVLSQRSIMFQVLRTKSDYVARRRFLSLQNNMLRSLKPKNMF